MSKFKLNNKKIVIGIIILLVGLFGAGLTYYIISRRTSKQLVEEVASAFETLDAMKLKKLTDESIIEYEKSIGDDENIVKKMNSIIVELEGEKLIKMKDIKQIRVATCQVEECTSSNQIKEIQKSFKDQLSDGTLWEGQIALYFRWTCLPDCAVPELEADYRRNNRRLS